jgi:hypothetical protein
MENDVSTRRKLEEWLEKSTVTPSASFECSTPAYSSTIAAQSLADNAEGEISNFTSRKADRNVPDIRATLGNGTVFIEGQLKDDLSICEIEKVCQARRRVFFLSNFSKLQDELQSRLTAVDFSFQIDEDLLADEDSMYTRNTNNS